MARDDERVAASPSDLTAPEPRRRVVSGSSSIHDRAIASGVLWQGSLRWLSQALSWTATIIVARRLSAEDYGIAGSAAVLVGFLILISESGIGRAIVLRRERDPAVLEQAHGAGILIGVAMAILMLIVAIPIARFYGEPRVAPVIATLSLVMLFAGHNAIPLAILQQKLEYRLLAGIEFAKMLTQAVTVLVGALLGLRYWSIALGLISGHLIVMLLVLRRARVASRWPTRRALGDILAYSRDLVLGSLSWYAYSNADFAIIGRVAGLGALGYYQFAWNIAQLPGEKLGNVLQAVVGPFFGAIGEDRRALRHYFAVLSELLVSVMLPVLCGFSLVSSIAVPLFFGAKWTASVTVMQILVISAAVSSLGLLSQHVLGATGHARVSRQVNLGALIALPVAFYLGARSGDLRAVAAVWLIAQPILIGIPLLRLRSTIDLSLRNFARRMVAPLACSALMVAVIFLLRPLVQHVALVLQLIILCAVGAIVYVGAFLAFFRESVTSMLQLLRSRP